MTETLIALGAEFDRISTNMTTITDLYKSGNIDLFPLENRMEYKGISTSILHHSDQCSIVYSKWKNAAWFPCHAHVNTQHAIAVVGRFIIIMNGKILELTPPNSILIPASTMHVVAGLDSNCEMAVVCVPKEDGFDIFNTGKKHG